MSGYKEFEGKTLDEAIRDACTFYDAAREKLEIDILNDASGGIFGLMGVRKARVRARLVQFSSVLEGLDGSPSKEKEASQKPREPEDGRQNGRKQAPQEDAPRRERGQGGRRPAAAPAPALAPVAETPVLAPPSGEPQCRPAPEEAARPQSKERQEGRQRRGRQQEPRRQEPKPQENADRQASEDFSDNAEGDMDGDDLRRLPLEQLDAGELEAVTRDVVTRMTVPLLGPCSISVTVAGDRLRVSLTDIEDPGLLIGRDGQTLAALQYLVTRMVSNRMKTLLRVQIDAGDYRERQDERLRELALSLAEKVKAGGRPQVTRPLSSYHRRVIHVTLQDDPLIQTHSKGEGEMKRVMVTRRKERQ